MSRCGDCIMKLSRIVCVVYQLNYLSLSLSCLCTVDRPYPTPHAERIFRQVLSLCTPFDLSVDVVLCDPAGVQWGVVDAVCPSRRNPESVCVCVCVCIYYMGVVCCFVHVCVCMWA